MALPFVVEATGTETQFGQINLLAGIVAEDHGQRLLDDGRWSVILYVDSQATIDQIRAAGLDVTIRLTPEQALARSQQIAEEMGDAPGGADALVSFAPPMSDDEVPGDFTLTFTPSTGPTLTLGKADLVDLGDELSAVVPAPGAGVSYAARARVTATADETSVFDGFELHALIVELDTPAIAADLPAAIEDPIALETTELDPDGDSHPDLPDLLSEADYDFFQSIGSSVGAAVA